MVSTQTRLPEIYRLKGVLIALIVLGHNTLFSDWYPRVFTLLTLYTRLQVNPRLWSRVFPRDRTLWKRGYVSAGT